MTWQERPRWQRWIFEAIVIIGIILLIRTWQHQDIATGDAPKLSGMTADNHILTLTPHPTQPTLIHFYAPWCPVCRAMHGNISSIAKDFPVIMVAVQTDPETLAKWLEEHPEDAAHQTINDEDARWFSAFGGKVLPMDIIMDTSGKIVSTEVGYSSYLGLYLRLYAQK